MIERCLNYRRIKTLIEWPLVLSSKVIYLIQSEKGIDEGVWTFEPAGNGVKGHADIGHLGRGKKAIAGAKAAIEWIFKNTGAEFIGASISRENKKACFIASWAGMKIINADDNKRHFKITRR